MIERLTPEEYQQRQISDETNPEAWLDKELAEQAEEQRYIYGDPPEEPAPTEEPQVPVNQAPAETRIPWGLIGVIAITGLIALSIVAVVAVKK